jgi:DNA-binding NarL/FixJ family response regulator
MPSVGPVRVVIADDRPLDRHLVRSLLPEEGFEVVGESSVGTEAARLVAEQQPDAILLHRNLTVSGSLVIPSIRSTSPLTKIVLIIRHPDEASVARPEHRADAYLEEGLGLKDLVAALRGLCRPPVAGRDSQEEAAGWEREGLEDRSVQKPSARVVLGEAEETYPGPLRSVLESEGFDIVGQASNPDELDRVLAVAEATVVVLDAKVGAIAVLAARESLPDAGIVVVWPQGVVSAVADEQVEPSHVYRDLGKAVRRAARLASWREMATAPTLIEGLARIPAETVRVRRAEHALEPAATSPASEGLRRDGVIVMMTAASLVLLIVAALALTMPDRAEMAAKSPRSLPSKSVVTPPPRSGGDGGTKGCGGPSNPITNEGRLGSHGNQGHHGDDRSRGNMGHHVQGSHPGSECRSHGHHGHQGQQGSKGNHAHRSKHGNRSGHGLHGLRSHSSRPVHGGTTARVDQGAKFNVRLSDVPAHSEVPRDPPVATCVRSSHCP